MATCDLGVVAKIKRVIWIGLLIRGKWGLGPRASMYEEEADCGGKLDKHVKPNEWTPDEWVRNVMLPTGGDEMISSIAALDEDVKVEETVVEEKERKHKRKLEEVEVSPAADGVEKVKVEEEEVVEVKEKAKKVNDEEVEVEKKEKKKKTKDVEEAVTADVEKSEKKKKKKSTDVENGDAVTDGEDGSRREKKEKKDKEADQEEKKKVLNGNSS